MPCDPQSCDDSGEWDGAGDEGPSDADVADFGDDAAAATLPCPHCRRDIHEDSERCPHCGDWIQPPAARQRAGAPLLIAAVVMIGLILWITLR